MATAVENHHKMQALSAICLAIWQRRDDLAKAGIQVDGFLGARAELTKLRRMRRNFYAPFGYKRQAAINDTQAAVASMYSNSRKSVSVTCGREVGGKGGSRNCYAMQVGWRWHHKVYKQFYDKQRLDCHDYFVLSAEEFRVNNRYIRIYEAVVYHFKTNKIEKAWIGQAAVGDQFAVLKGTSEEAIKGALKLFNQQIDRDLGRR